MWRQHAVRFCTAVAEEVVAVVVHAHAWVGWGGVAGTGNRAQLHRLFVLSAGRPTPPPSDTTAAKAVKVRRKERRWCRLGDTDATHGRLGSAGWLRHVDSGMSLQRSPSLHSPPPLGRCGTFAE
eukprot:TRINITY_DN1237_c2_g1_i2.p4 TRINITY_DN1237_c2_g1~~TRINITY_DN1237_c2_g1_i2.p4  ORF type:complete len:124 (+),score=11.33 TRINITY_DN1237_c2_g1_i2:162-533(+)